jgi:hypothetical protein
MGAPTDVFEGGMESMSSMGGMGLGGSEEGYGGTSAPMGSMAGMGAPAGVYGAMGPPPAGFMASMETNGEEAKNGYDNNYEDVE